jgi:hypothetical protein
MIRVDYESDLQTTGGEESSGSGLLRREERWVRPMLTIGARILLIL